MGYGTVQVDDRYFNDVLCVPRISCNLLLVYQITHSSEGKTITFTPQQVVIKDFKYPKHLLTIGIVDVISMSYRFNNLWLSHFPSVLMFIVMTRADIGMSKLAI